MIVLLIFWLISVRCPAVFSVSYCAIMRAVALVKRNIRSNVNCFVSRNMTLLSLCDNVHLCFDMYDNWRSSFDTAHYVAVLNCKALNVCISFPSISVTLESFRGSLLLLQTRYFSLWILQPCSLNDTWRTLNFQPYFHGIYNEIIRDCS